MHFCALPLRFFVQIFSQIWADSFCQFPFGGSVDSFIYIVFIHPHWRLGFPFTAGLGVPPAPGLRRQASPGLLHHIVKTFVVLEGCFKTIYCLSNSLFQKIRLRNRRHYCVIRIYVYCRYIIVFSFWFSSFSLFLFYLLVIFRNRILELIVGFFACWLIFVTFVYPFWYFGISKWL